MNNYIPVSWVYPFLPKGACPATVFPYITKPPLSPKTFRCDLGWRNDSVGKGACCISLMTSVHFWNPHKGVRREPTLQSYPLTYTHTLKNKTLHSEDTESYSAESYKLYTIAEWTCMPVLCMPVPFMFVPCSVTSPVLFLSLFLSKLHQTILK